MQFKQKIIRRSYRKSSTACPRFVNQQMTGVFHENQSFTGISLTYFVTVDSASRYRQRVEHRLICVQNGDINVMIVWNEFLVPVYVCKRICSFR